MVVENKKKQYESGHAKLLESWDKLIAFGETLDQARINPPSGLKLSALKTVAGEGGGLQLSVGNSRADWRTSALARAVVVDTFETRAAQAVGQLAGRGASKETVKDARGYVQKLQGKRAKAKAKDNPEALQPDESEKGVSASQQSSAAMISTYFELLDFLEAQSEYAGVTKAELLIENLRAAGEEAQAKHEQSINAAAKLSNDRRERDKFFYLNDDSICELARRFKELVKGEYGANSPEYKAVRAIEFRKR
ncbi:MAG: hypothetical protein WA584_20225 [Pyrinomonadaceae bacterium]